MAKEKIFRETPFNGYNRDDVMAYIAEIDKKNTELRAADVQEKNSLAADLEAKTQEVEKLNGVIDSLNFAVEEKTAAYDELAKEFEAYKAENESKAALPDPEVVAAEKKEYEDKIAVLTAELEAAKAKISEQDDQIRSQIENICTLQATQDTSTAVRARLEDAEKSIAERDEKINFLQQGWEQYKKNYGKYMELAESAEKIINDAHSEAGKILASAEDSAAKTKAAALKEKQEILDNINGEIQMLISNAVKESGRIISSAEERARLIRSTAISAANETRDKLNLIKSSVSGILSNIDFAIMNIDPEKEPSNQD
jgi:chromosome segregation ATPase